MSWGAALGSLLDPVVNFTLFAIALYVLLRGPLREYLRDRTARLRAALDAGAKARREADELREALQRDLADLPRRREALHAELLETAARQRDVLLENARRAAARIRRDADAAAAQEEAAARAALRRELAAAAVRGATDMVRRAVGTDDHRRFVADFIREAEAL